LLTVLFVNWACRVYYVFFVTEKVEFVNLACCVCVCVVCGVCVYQAHTPQVQNYAAKHRQTIRNMPE